MLLAACRGRGGAEVALLVMLLLAACGRGGRVGAVARAPAPPRQGQKAACDPGAPAPLCHCCLLL